MPLYDFLRSLMLPLQEINRLLPNSGKIFDLGCGEGTIARYLAQVKSRQIIGVDANSRRLPKSELKNLHFELGDIRNYNLKSPIAVVISDVLHHLNFKDQEKVLKNIADNLKKGGVLLIVDIDTDEIIRSKISRFWDFILYPQDKIYYRNSKVFIPFLSSLGFKVDIQWPIRLSPRSTVLYYARKI